MKFIGNLLWIIFGGMIAALVWCFYGILWSITIIGLPVGLQCFKFAALSLSPFGKDVAYGGGTVHFVANIIWIITSGLPMAFAYLVWGCILSVTIIGIPFGKQFFKLAKLALMPFGATIVEI